MPDSADLFEMRRLEALSNTIFGVAMTLLAYNFPKGQVLNGVPVWSNIWATYQSQVIALLISFMVAGMFWISHQRRLAYQPHATRPVLYLNLLFLLSIILLPVTTGLYGSYGNTGDIVMLYSCHLTVLAVSNGILWLLAGLARGHAPAGLRRRHGRVRGRPGPVGRAARAPGDGACRGTGNPVWISMVLSAR